MGGLMFLAGFGVLTLLHHDMQPFAQRLNAHNHLDPAAHYPKIFIDVASQLTVPVSY